MTPIDPSPDATHVGDDHGDGAPRLSVLVPCRDAAETIGATITSLAAQDFRGPFEVVLIDNGSTDRSVAEAQRAAPSDLHLRIVRGPQDPSIGRTLRAGVDAARADHLVIVDADDVAASGFLRAVDAGLHRHPVTAARLEAGRLNPEWSAAARPLEQSEGLCSWPGFLPWAQGTGLGFRREAWDAVEGFTPGMQGGADIDMCWWMQLAGHELVWLEDAVIHYRLRDSSVARARQAFRYGQRGTIRYRWWRDRGMRRPGILRSLSRFARVVIGLPRLVTRAGRARWLFDAAFLAGRIAASVRTRTLYI